MARPHHCPRCDADISDNYQEDDYDTGIVGGWFCDTCDLPVDIDPCDESDDE